MRWRLLTKNDAKSYVNKWREMSEDEFSKLTSDWEKHINKENLSQDEIKLRFKLYRNYYLIKHQAKTQPNKRGSLYTQDLMFAIKMSEILKEFNFSVRDASNDDIWRFISVILIPDVVYDRWKEHDNPRKFNDERFWETTRRIWLKVLWWYVYLSFKNDLKFTERILADNNADEISQLVERAGRTGYRVQLYREIMYHYSLVTIEDKIKEKNLLSRILQLNIIWTGSIEPELIDGGLSNYVKSLFNYFGYLKEDNHGLTE